MVRTSDQDASWVPLEAFQARPTGRRPRGKPRTRWRDYISHLAWERLGIPQEELENFAGEKVGATLLGPQPPRPCSTWMDGWMDGFGSIWS